MGYVRMHQVCGMLRQFRQYEWWIKELNSRKRPQFIRLLDAYIWDGVVVVGFFLLLCIFEVNSIDHFDAKWNLLFFGDKISDKVFIYRGKWKPFEYRQLPLAFNNTECLYMASFQVTLLQFFRIDLICTDSIISHKASIHLIYCLWRFCIPHCTHVLYLTTHFWRKKKQNPHATQ